MQPTYISVGHLFGSQTRHTVPLFQRPYVWSQEEQWEPLWEDLHGLIKRIIERGDNSPVAGHFLGTVVLEQAPNQTGSLPRREVIDGQQRLTTLQLLLKAAQHALQNIELASGLEKRNAIGVAARQIGFLTENPAFSLDEERYKVWPTNEDRDAFRAVMDSSHENGVTGQNSRMANAYSFFRDTFSKYLGEDVLVSRVNAFAASLKDHLRLIVLDLDASDEPQAIFETLNAHGTPLLPADLMKNWLLWEASRQDLDINHLYEKFWRQFDKDHDYWRERVGVGHASRARVDTFLQNWLTRNTLDSVSAKHLYDRFLRYVGGMAAKEPARRLDVASVMGGIRSDADRYERIDRASGPTRFDVFLRRLKVLDVVVLHPVLLSIMDRSGSNQHDLDKSAVAIESYLIRRSVCGYQTRGYGTLAIALLKVVADTPEEQPVSDAIIEHLRFGTSESDAWPDDEMFRSEWVRRKFYGGLRRDRVLMILQAIEEKYQEYLTKSEPVMIFNFANLQIEHIMPQKWHAHWGMDASISSTENRNYVIHGIGNLTLVSQKLNPSLSNAPWHSNDSTKSCKRDALAAHSKLELNRRLLSTHADWSELQIRQRAEELFEVAREIWPLAPIA